MNTTVVKISNVMSLEDKVRIIRTFDKLKTLQEKWRFVGSHKRVANIIKNKDKILAQQKLMQTKLEAAKKGFNLHMSMRQDLKKVSFLKLTMFEWYQRVRNTVLIDISFRCFREKVEIAREILNIQQFTLTDPWILNLRLTCNNGKAKDNNKYWSLNLKNIVRYVLKKEGVSRKKTQSKYGIFLDDVEEDTITMKDEEGLLETRNSEESESIDIVKHVFESSEESQDGDPPASPELEFENENDQECVGVRGTSPTASLEDDQLLMEGNPPISPKHDSIEICELVEDHKDFLVYLVHDDDDTMSVEKNVHDDELLQDNKDALKYLNLDTDSATPTKDSADDYGFLKTNQDAFLHLYPLREYLISQDNVIALKLLTQMEATLI